MTVYRTLSSMSFSTRIYCLSIMLFLYLVLPGFTQDTSDRLIVAFVEDNSLNTVVRDETLGDSVSSLLNSVDPFTVETVAIDLRSPIIRNIDLVILVRPLRRLDAQQTANLWHYLDKGGNLLLAIDPNRYNGVNTEDSQSGLNQLLNIHYGISWQDNMLIEPWFDVIPLFDISRSWSQGIADEVTPHIITQPLVDFGIPIRFWIGRSLQVESVNGSSLTNALIYTEGPHGETSSFNLNEPIPGQFDINIGEDAQGRLVLASVAESLENRSRIAVIGDSEIFQNGFGQLNNPEDETLPLQLGSYLFSQRLLQWLLEIPEEVWLPLPEIFTWIAVDGQAEDWASYDSVVYNTDTNEVVPPSLDIEQVQLLHNDNYAYVLVETVESPAENLLVTLAIDLDGETVTVILEGGSVSFVDSNGDVQSIPDARYRLSESIEARIPLRIVGENPIYTEICISDTSTTSDCYEETLSSSIVGQIDPLSIRFPSVSTGYVITTAQLQDSPEGLLIVELQSQTQLAILGRNTLGDWVKVANGRYEGWVEAAELAINARRNLLPVTD